nr:MAG TPA: Protein of unknown function (DUF1642) [Caudoviricetes sp.]
MNKQELFEAVIELPVDCSGSRPKIDKLTTLELIRLLDEPEAGHADEAPRYVKNILARLRELPLHDREVWLKAIMSEFEHDFSHAKWREGYEQGKFEGMVKREKVTIPQFVADWYEENKDGFEGNLYRCAYNIPSVFDGAKLNEFERWFLTAGTKPFQTLVNMHQFGYEVEKEKRYLVKVKGVSDNSFRLKYHPDTKRWIMGSNVNNSGLIAYHTRKELEEAGFGWIFSCEGIEVEEVE